MLKHNLIVYLSRITNFFLNSAKYIYSFVITMEDKNIVEQQNVNTRYVINEGKAKILIVDKNVFYNPVQEFNRDLSIAVLGLFGKRKTELVDSEATQPVSNDSLTQSASQDGITILEALSATGLRSIRYAKEVPGVKQIIANDISAKAVDSIKKNILDNNVEHLVTASHEDATMLMYQRRKDRFDAVDLDPYGCPSIFLDGAVQCIANGGLLMVTATDMAVLAGNSPETCYVKYGAVSLKSKSCHELALRILLQHIATHAGRYGRYIVPLLSISVDFYIRVFVTVHSGQLQCKNNTSNLGMVYQCNGCESMTLQPLGMKRSGAFKLPNGPPVDRLCKFCNHAHHLGGPIWLGSLHDQQFVSQLLDDLDKTELNTRKRMRGVLSVVLEELDVPLYYTLDRLMSIVRCQTPPMVVFRSALLNAGYKVTFSHANKVSIKTDAPNEVIWDIVRAWEKTHQSRRDRMEKGSVALVILEADTKINVNFDLHPNANPRSRQTHMSRFQVNPTANWGPGARSTTIVDANERTSKRKRNQNKNSKHRKEKTFHEKPEENSEEEKSSNTLKKTNDEQPKECSDEENSSKALEIGEQTNVNEVESIKTENEREEAAQKNISELPANGTGSHEQEPPAKLPKINAS